MPQSRHGRGVIIILTFQIIQLIEGKASAYVFASPGCKKWDTCAPEVILHAVGGQSISLGGITVYVQF